MLLDSVQEHQGDLELLLSIGSLRSRLFGRLRDSKRRGLNIWQQARRS
jgi:hypothetical protein